MNVFLFIYARFVFVVRIFFTKLSWILPINDGGVKSNPAITSSIRAFLVLCILSLKFGASYAALSKFITIKNN